MKKGTSCMGSAVATSRLPLAGVERASRGIRNGSSEGDLCGGAFRNV
jgi:hypothetical protein